MTVTRRALLAAFAGGASGCLLPAREPPRVHHPRGPLGALLRPTRKGPGVLVGAATIDLTPPSGAPVWLAGFGPNRPMRVLHDRIGAQCVLFDDGTRRVALVMADVIGLMQPSIRRIRALVGPAVEVAVASTHNHASPDTIGFWGPALLSAVPHRSGLDPAYLAVLERRIAQLVGRAAAAARPARLRIGEAPLEAAGLITNLRPPFTIEQSALVLEARDEETDAAIASLVHFACHVEAMGPRSHGLGAGFPALLRAQLDEATGGTTMFVNGALGGMIVPQVEDSAGEDERRQLDRRIATAGVSAAREALRTARPLPAESVRLVRKAVEIPATNALFAWLETQGIVEPRPRGPSGALITEIGRLELGRDLALALAPGEPTPQVGAALEAQLKARGFAHARVVGLADDELGYLLDPASQYDDPEFAYEVSMSAGRDVVPALLAAFAAL